MGPSVSVSVAVYIHSSEGRCRPLGENISIFKLIKKLQEFVATLTSERLFLFIIFTINCKVFRCSDCQVAHLGPLGSGFGGLPVKHKAA